MFPLTRPFRQGLTTVALVLSTVVPTIIVSIHAWRIHCPGHIRDVEIELRHQLGLQVTLQAVRYPRPGEVIYQGIVLRQEEPRSRGLAEIARAGLVRLVRGDRELTLHAEDLRLRGESPRHAVAQLGSLIQRSRELPFDRINLTAPACELDMGGEGLSYAVEDLAGEFVTDSTHPTLRVAYRMTEKGTGGGTRCELTLERDRAEERVRTALVFKTVEGPPLPARVIEPFFSSHDWLGPKAKVEGTLSLRQAGARDWDAEFEGQLIDVDLATLVGRRFPRHRLLGTARVALRHARWGDRPGQGPGWREAKGELLASQGTVGVDLLGALAREMKFRLALRATRLDPRRRELEFRSLGIAFDMRSDGEIRLTGSLGNEFSPDTVLVSDMAPLAFAPTGAASVYGLIKTLFPVADSPPGVLVPLTSESRVLFCLPVAPEIAARPARTLEGN
jgi:hypothetical protein